MKKFVSQNQAAIVRSILLTAFLLGLAGSGWGQTTLYTQNFGTGTSFPSGWTSSPGSGNGSWTNITENASSGYPGASGGSNAAHRYQNPGTGTLTYSNNFSTIGYTNITVLWGSRRYGNNVSTFQYSIDGTNWTTVSFTENTATNGTWMLVNGGTRIDLTEDAAGVANLRFRWTHTSTGYSAYNNYRIDDFSVQGTLIVAPSCSALTYPANSSTGVERNPIFSWNSAPTATGYKFYLGTSTGNYDLVNGALLTATSYTYGSLLSANTGYYWKVVPANSAGDATGCTEWSFTTGEDVVYCNSQGTSQAGEYISNIAVGDYSKASGSSGYSDFTTEIIQVDNSANPSFTLTPSSSTNDKYWAVWIDFNGNGDFTDSGEEVYSGYSKTALTGTLSNIAGKVVNTTMRIAMKGDPGSSDLTVPGGTITAEHNDSPAGEDIAKLIDNSTDTKYLTLNGAAGGNYVWVQYQFPNSEKYVVTKYSMTSANDFEERDPLSWTLQGSNNGTTWTTIDTRTNEDFASRFLTRVFTSTNTTAYNYYRLDMRNNSGSILQLAEWELFGISMPAPCETFAFGEVEDYTVNIGPACSNPTGGGTIAAPQSICSGNDPAAFTSTSLPAGHTGTLEYKWQYSTSDSPYSWNDITSSNSATYDDATTLTADRWYRRLARVDCKDDWTGAAASNVLEVTVNALPTFTAEETKAISCYGATDGEITITVTGDATPFYYRYSDDGGTTWIGGDSEGWIQFTSGNTQIITGLGDGTYLIHIKDANGCVQKECE